MEWINSHFYNDDDVVEALAEAGTRLSPVYYLGIARDESGLNVGIMQIGIAGEAARLIPVPDPADLARTIRVYAEVYGCLAGNVKFDDLTPRGRALVACRPLSPLADYTDAGNVERAVALAGEAGIDAAAPILLGENMDRAEPDWAALERRLARISYTIVHLTMPADALERLRNLPKSVLDDLNIVGFRFPESEDK